jgi:hypothetical protein
VAATSVYRPEAELDVSYGMALHTVTVCDLAQGGFDCQGTLVLGPPGRVFYVSPDAVYVWTSSWAQRTTDKSPSLVFRMPLDGLVQVRCAPQAVRWTSSRFFRARTNI